MIIITIMAVQHNELQCVRKEHHSYEIVHPNSDVGLYIDCVFQLDVFVVKQCSIILIQTVLVKWVRRLIWISIVSNKVMIHNLTRLRFTLYNIEQVRA